jgi:hypothetical protein
MATVSARPRPAYSTLVAAKPSQAMIGPEASSPSGNPQTARIRMPMTRPRISSSLERSITAASGVRL